MNQKTRRNVESFNSDVLQGRYAYYSDKLSSSLANGRIDSAIAEMFEKFPLAGKTVLDIGSGDGATAILLCKLGAKRVVGIDPAGNAVAAAAKRCDEDSDAQGKTAFYCGDIDTLELDEQFDLAVFSRVIHHLPNPAHALKQSALYAPAVAVIEPNGWNPVVKLIERLSTYHREHDEKSYTSATLSRWCADAGFTPQMVSYVNLVPMFCPAWAAKLCSKLTPLFEAIPLANKFCCGQTLIYAEKA